MTGRPDISGYADHIDMIWLKRWLKVFLDYPAWSVLPYMIPGWLVLDLGLLCRDSQLREFGP